MPFGWAGFDKVGMMQINESNRKSRTSALSKLYRRKCHRRTQHTTLTFVVEFGMQLASLRGSTEYMHGDSFVPGGVIKQMRADGVLFGALSAVLKPGCSQQAVHFVIKHRLNGQHFDENSLLSPNKTRLLSSRCPVTQTITSKFQRYSPSSFCLKMAIKMDKITYSRRASVIFGVRCLCPQTFGENRF